MQIRTKEYLDLLNFTYAFEGHEGHVCLEFPGPPAPDCLYTTKSGEEIGIEHTTLILENHPKLGDVQRMVEEKSNLILRRIRQECKARHYHSTDMLIYLDYQLLKSSMDINTLVQSVMEYLESFISSSEVETSYWNSRSTTSIQGVQRLALNKNEGSKYVRVMHSHWNSDSRDLEPLLIDGCSRKKDKISGYKESCERLWLLLVNPEPMFSPITELDEEFILPSNISEGWDDIFIYNRIHSDFKSLLRK